MTTLQEGPGYIAISPMTADKLHILSVGCVQLNLDGFQARVNGSIVQLPAKEFSLLAELMAHAGKALTRRQLLDAAWGPGYPDRNKTLNVHILRLRNRLRQSCPECQDSIRTIRDVGYIFDITSWPERPISA